MKSGGELTHTYIYMHSHFSYMYIVYNVLAYKSCADQLAIVVDACRSERPFLVDQLYIPWKFILWSQSQWNRV